jgi:competence ComEA-like helix-hairpin-helix protein
MPATTSSIESSPKFYRSCERNERILTEATMAGQSPPLNESLPSPEESLISAIRARNAGLAGLAMGALGLVWCWGAIRPTAPHSAAPLPSPFVVDLNRATVAELQLLPGIGPKTVEAILNYRSQQGRIDRIEELMNIPGIKEGRLATIRPYLVLGDDAPEGFDARP